MRKFPKVKYPNDPETDGLKNGEVVVTEKVDGANFRFTYNEDDDLVVGTRNHTYHEDDENLPKAFRHAVEYIQNAVSYEPRFQRYTVFGEAMHLHSLDYDGIDWHNPAKGSPHVSHTSDTPNVVVFDAWDNEESEWISWGAVITLAEEMGLETTQVLERGDPDDLSFEIPDESMFGGNPEGIVARRYDGTVRAKKVSDDFREQNAVSFEDPSKAESDAAEFVAAYVSRNRIEKTAHKLVDEGHYERLCMPMMEDLPREVLKDVGAELFWSDLLSDGGFEAEWDDDFKGEVRSKTSKKCARVLKTECQQI